MAVRLVVRVDAPRAHPDRLTVRDAFEHVLDLFDLAVYGDSDPNRRVEWRLVTASMQSPLTVVAEAVPVVPGMDIDEIARKQTFEFVRNYEQLKGGRVPKAWSAGMARTKAKNVAVRNRKGIGRTSIIVGTPEAPLQQQVDVTEEDAQVAVQALGVPTLEAALKGKEQIGSLEGKLVHVGTYYNQPAVALRERKTSAEVWCTVPDEFRSQIANEANFMDVWSGRRVRVRGRIVYDREGNIARVYASEIHRIEPETVEVGRIQDPRFTDGMTVAEYLEKLRDGDLG
jgi:hypothetical protein